MKHWFNCVISNKFRISANFCRLSHLETLFKNDLNERCIEKEMVHQYKYLFQVAGVANLTLYNTPIYRLCSYLLSHSTKNPNHSVKKVSQRSSQGFVKGEKLCLYLDLLNVENKSQDFWNKISLLLQDLGSSVVFG